MGKMARALSDIQQGMLRNNPRHVTDSVNEANEALGGMLNTHRCLLESGVKIQRKMESHPAMKKLGIVQRPRSASVEDTPKNKARGEKSSAPSLPLEKTPKRGKGGSSPSYAQVATTQPPNKEGDWHLVTKKRGKEKKKEKKDRRAGDPVPRAQATVAKQKLKHSTPARSGEAIRVSARDGQAYAYIFSREARPGDRGEGGNFGPGLDEVPRN